MAASEAVLFLLVRVGSIGFLSLSDILYTGKRQPNGIQQEQYTFSIAINKIHIQITRRRSGTISPTAQRGAWITLTVEGVKVSLKLLTNSRTAQPTTLCRQKSLATAVPQKAWWSSLWVLKFAMAKISAIPFQFVLSILTNIIALQITEIEVLLEDLGQFRVEGVTLDSKLFAHVENEINSSNKNISHHYREHSHQENHSIKNSRHMFSNKTLRIILSFSSLSVIDIESTTLNQENLISVEPEVNITEINLGLDGILHLVKVIKGELLLAKKSSLSSQNAPLAQLPPPMNNNNNNSQNKSFSFFDSSIGRRIVQPRRKKTPIDFLSAASINIERIHVKYDYICLDNELSLPTGLELTLSEVCTSIKKLDHHTNNDNNFSSGKKKSIFFVELLPKVLSFEFNFSLASGYADLFDSRGKTRTMQIDKIMNTMKISKPFDQFRDDEDPNLFSLIGNLDILNPELLVDYQHLSSYLSILNSLKNLEVDMNSKNKPLSELPSNPSLPVSSDPQNKFSDIPKIVITVSILRPTLKFNKIPNFHDDQAHKGRNDDSSLIFGFQDILVDFNGDYNELNTLSQQKQKLSRRYSKGWVAPSFSFVYNLVACLKTRNMRVYTLENDLLNNHSWEVNVVASALGSIQSDNKKAFLEKETIQADLSWLIDVLEIKLCDKDDFSLLRNIFKDINNFNEKDDHYSVYDLEEENPEICVHPPSPSTDAEMVQTLTIPETVQLHFSLTSVNIKIAEKDSVVDPSVSRGFDVRLQAIALEYRGARVCVDPTSSYKERAGLGLSSNDDKLDFTKEEGGQIRGFFRGFKIIPILALWDLELLETTRPLLSIKEIEAHCLVYFDYEKPDILIVELKVKIEGIKLDYSLFYHYCLLVATMNLKDLISPLTISKTPSSPPTPTLPFPKNSSPIPKIKFEFNLGVNYVDIFTELPENLHLFIRIDKLSYRFASASIDHGLNIKKIRAFGINPSNNALWDELLNLIDTRILILGDFNKLSSKKTIRFHSEAVHARIPFNYIMADILDNIGNLVKSIKTLRQRLILGKEDISFEPEEEGPICLPTLQFKIENLTFRLEDDPFEGQLGLIWKIGGIEQRSRIGRDAAFKTKVEAIKAHEAQRQSNMEVRRTSIDSNFISNSSNYGFNQGNNELNDGSDSNAKKSPLRPKLSPRANANIEAAQLALDEYNSRNWIKRVKAADETRAKSNITRNQNNSEQDQLPIKTTDTSSSPPSLLKVTIERALITLSTPSFPMEQLPQFMHKIGKGLPLDTKFTLLIPMHLNCKLREAWVQLRDYPTPLAHIPPMESFETRKLYSSVFDGDLVIGEELRGVETVRKAIVTVVPDGFGRIHSILVPRTCSPVKIYSDLNIDINSTHTTVFSWGISMQPAVLDIARVFETFTKPSPDPSELVGFWDKLRLMMHVRIMMEFKGGGDVRFLSKGLRDPYFVTGLGSGFVLCFRNGVKIRLGYSNDAGEFLQVDSEEFILGIPDLAEMVANGSLSAENHIVNAKKFRKELIRDPEASTMKTQSSSDTLVDYRSNAGLIKVIMKIGGGVRYGMGCQFHRSCRNDQGICPRCHGQGNCRLNDFVPHYEVTTRVPEYAFATDNQVYDSFRGFRSDIVHLSFSMMCPIIWNDDDSVNTNNINKNNNGEKQQVGSYNSIHVTPKSIQHAFAWISLFDNAMTLPIRTGALFPIHEIPSPKLPKFLHTLKYKVCLAPLFLSYFYKEDALDDWTNGRTQIVGLKGKIGHFKIDIHQKIQEKFVQVDEGEVKVRDMTLHEAEMDLKNLDVRGIAARYVENSLKTFGGDDDEFEEQGCNDQLGKDDDFVLINPEDEEWVDEDDYKEIDSSLPTVKPKVRVLPFMRCPQLMYYKHAPEDDTDEDKKMDQEAHVCVMGQGRDTREIQICLLKERLNQIGHEILKLEQLVKDIDELIVSDAKNQNLRELRDESLPEDNIHGYNVPLWADSLGQFSHRFVIHNAQVLWNNSLRNLIYKFWDLVEQQQGLTYYMSTNAVKLIRDLQKYSEKIEKPLTEEPDSNTAATSFGSEAFDAQMAAELLRKLVGEENTSFVVPNEQIVADNITGSEKNPIQRKKSMNQLDDIPAGYTLWKNYLIQLFNTQINFQSDKNPSASIIMSSERAQLKSVSILEDRLKGDANEVIKSRILFGLDNTQFLLTWKKEFNNEYSRRLTANNFGAQGKENWPAWVPVEALFNYDRQSSFPFQRIVKRTSATMLYEKFNHLRIISSDMDQDDNSESTIWGQSDGDKFDKRIDSWRINFPRFKFSATSAQYCVFVDMVSDLLMYREPAKKERTERLEAILFAADLNDLRGAAELVSSLQQKIRQMDEQRYQIQSNLAGLGEDGVEELWKIKARLLNSQEELYVLMEAITATQTKKEKAENNTALKAVVTANEVVWLMKLDNRKSFCECGLTNAHFVWMTREDNSSKNTLEIDHLRVLNKMPSPVFTELIQPYIRDPRRQVDFNRHKMLRIYWHEREPVAGIAVVEHLEVNFFPLKFQMQYEVGKQIIMYIFPEKREEIITATNDTIDQQQPTISEHLSTTPAEGLYSPLSPRRNSLSSKGAVAAAVNKFTEATIKDDISVVDGVYSNNETDTIGTTPNEPMSPSSNLTSGPSKKSRICITADNAYSKESDELALMKTRASQNKTFIYIKIPGVRHNFSYQGAKEKNIEDLYDFVFELPTLEYQNRTWSWFDLLDHLKRDILKTILLHTGALVREKLLSSRRGRQVITPNAVSPSLASIYEQQNRPFSASSTTLIMPVDQTQCDAASTFSDETLFHENAIDTLIPEEELSLEEEFSDKGSIKSNDGGGIEITTSRTVIVTKAKKKKGFLGLKSKKNQDIHELSSFVDTLPIMRSRRNSDASNISQSKSSSSPALIVSEEDEKESKRKLLLGKLY
ncbi:5579_t:CDS:2 [Ambispora gerdemannii]|uniref:5579_t:CDS:1 n=1 Tax=Ambispora gerdemannii TaxID=144530 RepID=A0A9N8VEA7_9GLOM|nr:5579_t:CDS:2 [Ambispora gerdemannii]